MEHNSLEYILRCVCGDKSDHVIHIAQYDLGEKMGDDELGHCLITTRLDPRKRWYERIWVGIKYVFGVNQYQYIETMVDVDILKEVVLELKDTRSDSEKENARKERTKVTVL